MRKKKTKEPNIPQLSKEDLLRCELASAKTEAAINALAAQKMRLERLRADCENKIHAAEQQIQVLNTHMTNCIKDGEALWGEMGKTYGVDFKRATYDTETGVIHEMPEDTKGGKE